ncbi:helix-turn-helix transcriptional regulator [Streptomyces sp. NPDC002623]
MDVRTYVWEKVGDGVPPDSWRDLAIAWRHQALLVFDRVPIPIALCDADGTIRLANPAMAAEWGQLPGRLNERNVLELFQPRTEAAIQRIREAARLRHVSRFPVDVTWTAPDGTRRRGGMSVDLIGDIPDAPIVLLLMLRPAPDRLTSEHEPVSAMEAQILALVANGLTSAQIGRQVGLTPDGVNYHLGQMSHRWNTSNRTALVARAYTLGILEPQRWPPVPAL